MPCLQTHLYERGFYWTSIGPVLSCLAMVLAKQYVIMVILVILIPILSFRCRVVSFKY